MVPMVQTEINGRWSLFLPEHRAARPEWVTGWERERLDSMYEHLTRLVDATVDAEGYGKPGPRPVIIDVGVEEGDLTALYSKWGCDVVLVEPNPAVWPNVRAIWNANGLRLPLSGWVGFAGDRDDDLRAPHVRAWLNAHTRVHDPAPDDDGWPLCAYGPVIGDHAFLHLAQHAHMVPQVTLDTLIRDGSVAGDPIKVDAITMDVEGSELRVLRGAYRILVEDRPLVWVSVHQDGQWMAENYPQDDLVSICGFMDALGYEYEPLATDHEHHAFFRPSLKDGVDVGPFDPTTGKHWGHSTSVPFATMWEVAE